MRTGALATFSLGRVLLTLGLVVGSLCADGGAARAGTGIHVLLDRRPDGVAAPLFVALAKGLFRTENLDVIANASNGARDAIEHLAKGDGDIAIADLDELIRFRDQAAAPQLKAVFILFNR